MRCIIPEISWHNRDPVLSVDIGSKISLESFKHYNDYENIKSVFRLATGGTDSHVVVWYLFQLQSGSIRLECVIDLTWHNKAVNVVRFSTTKDILASGDDEAIIILWKQQDNNAINLYNEDIKEQWSVWKTLKGHIQDVYDLCWSSDNQLLSGSVDNSAILWDIQKGKVSLKSVKDFCVGKAISTFSDHNGYVQGVSLDPKGKYIATICSDSKKLHTKVSKDIVSTKFGTASILTHLFHDDTLKSFFRRLSFSPDGELLLVPSGIIEEEQGKTMYTTYIFVRDNFSKPVMYFPSDKYTLAVSCCPLLFQLRTVENKVQKLFDLPYRIVFAVAQQDSVLLYDSQQSIPFAHISNIHYTRLSDLSWSTDGSLLMISSTDGYCSFISFKDNELGQIYIPN